MFSFDKLFTNSIPREQELIQTNNIFCNIVPWLCNNTFYFVWYIDHTVVFIALSLHFDLQYSHISPLVEISKEIKYPRHHMIITNISLSGKLYPHLNETISQCTKLSLFLRTNRTDSFGYPYTPLFVLINLLFSTLINEC